MAGAPPFRTRSERPAKRGLQADTGRDVKRATEVAEDLNHEDLAEETPAANAGNAPTATSNDTFMQEAFLDLSNVELGAQGAGIFNMDVMRVVEAAVHEFAQRLGMAVADGDGTRRGAAAATPQGPTVVCRRVFCFTTQAVNVHPDDQAFAVRDEALITSLAQLPGVEVRAVPLDFHGHHLRAGRRLAAPTRAERTFRPVEKGVDVALASHLVKRCLASDRPDGVMLVSGDADFAPAIQQVVRLKPPVVVMVASFADSLSAAYRDTALTGYPPIVLDEHVKALCADRNRPIRKGGRPMIDPQRRTPAGPKPGNGDRGPHNPCADLCLGRIVVTRPHYGALEVYHKVGGVLGSRFLSQVNGGKYGTTRSVREYFSQPGTYQGWAFLDSRRCIVFLFVRNDEDNPPAPILAVDTPDGPVGLDRECTGTEGLAQGDWVAFYMGPPQYRHNAPPLRRATHLYPVDEKHPLLLAQLAAAGRLRFPQHAEIAEKFLDALPGLDEVLGSQDAEAIQAALNRLADDPKVPGDVRMVARAERGRLGSGGPRTPAAAGPQAPSRTPATKRKTRARRAGKTGGRDPLAGDVAALDLQVE